MIIIPYYMRYTEFTLEERLMMSKLAEVRVSAVTSFLIAKAHYNRAVLDQADQEVIDGYQCRFDTLLEAIGQIDCAIFDFYLIHGRVN